jgi:viroplasmin and RNaseH domain-containing protein
VSVGYQPGIYTSWREAGRQVSGCKGQLHKKFRTLGEACEYMRGANVGKDKDKKNEIY